MRILAIETSCDETAAAVTDGVKVISNIIWSQASAHAKFGGVMPSLAQRMHEERIDFVIKRALGSKHKDLAGIDAIAVTVGPGLSIALGVGVNKAKELSKKYKKRLIAANHTEAHLLSSLARSYSTRQSANSSKTNDYPLSTIRFPALGLVVSGKNTQLVLSTKIGKYKILAETEDDALGEALDKSARLLGFGYPGGAILEKISKDGDPRQYSLPLPLVSDKVKNRFSYSGLKTAFVRIVSSMKNLNKEEISDLGASFQEVAFEHVIKVLDYQINNLDPKIKIKDLLLGGGVANNVLLRSKLRKILRKHNISLRIPYSNKLLADNAAMIGVSAFFKAKEKDFISPNKIDRNPRLKISE